MNDLLEELFVEMLALRYGEKDRTAAVTMARFARLVMGQQPERKRRKSSASNQRSTEDRNPVGSALTAQEQPAAGDKAVAPPTAKPAAGADLGPPPRDYMDDLDLTPPPNLRKVSW